MAGEDPASSGGSPGGGEDASGADAAGRSPASGSSLGLPSQSPLFHAQHAARYDRQETIKQYEAAFGCRLVVMSDVIFPDSIVLFEDLIHDADPAEDLHLILNTPGGDGETAIRLVRSAQARCRRLVVVVPDQAKSAGTLLALGADEIVMGPTSDLGPVDPQFRLTGGRLHSAKDIIDAVDSAMADVQARPETYPVHASLLADIDALLVQAARSAMARTEDLVREALCSCTSRDAQQVHDLQTKLKAPLIDTPKSHAAVFGSDDALDAGLPVTKAPPQELQWQMVWRLWMKYVALGEVAVYEGRVSSQIHNFNP